MNDKINIAIIQALWHQDLTRQIKQDCMIKLNDYSLIHDLNVNILEYEVPGSAELPVLAKIVTETQKVDAIICIGVLIQGQSDHYVYIANQVSYGCQKVAIETNTPVIFGVLTCQNIGLAKARVNGKHSKCGEEFALAAINMVRLVNSIRNPTNNRS